MSKVEGTHVSVPCKFTVIMFRKANSNKSKSHAFQAYLEDAIQNEKSYKDSCCWNFEVIQKMRQ